MAFIVLTDFQILILDNKIIHIYILYYCGYHADTILRVEIKYKFSVYFVNT